MILPSFILGREGFTVDNLPGNACGRKPFTTFRPGRRIGQLHVEQHGLSFHGWPAVHPA
jgi:hypothetical protein